jgi:acetylornithine deacetylase
MVGTGQGDTPRANELGPGERATGAAGLRTALENDVVALAREARDEVVDLTRELVACVTTARKIGDAPRDEVKLQTILAARLRALGARVDVFEPRAIPEGHPLFPAGLDFAGRPQLAATLRGAGGGRSLLLNGHIDAVEAQPDAWAHDPYDAVERDGLLFGRGVVDMKGGIAAQLMACEVLHRAGVRLSGDLVFTTDTDEEGYGAGSWCLTEHGVRADGGVIAEPSSFNACVACRGTLKPHITVRGRAGHTQVRHTHWSAGGPVNAIEKLVPILEAVAEIRADWSARADCRHELLEPPDIIPTLVSGGTWEVTYPAACTLTCDVLYLPGQGDADGSGTRVKREIQKRLSAAAAADPWFAEHPLEWSWGWSAPPAEVSADLPIVSTVLQAGSDIGRAGAVSGMNSWHDAASFVLYAGTPSLSFGPGDIHRAHTVDECIPIDDLVDYVAAMCLVALRFCGT